MTLLWNLSAETKKKAPAKKKPVTKKKTKKKEEPVVDLPVMQMLPPGTIHERKRHTYANR